MRGDIGDVVANLAIPTGRCGVGNDYTFHTATWPFTSQPGAVN